MGAAKIREIDRHYLEEVWNKGNVALTGEFLTPDTIYHGMGGREVKGIEGMRQYAMALRFALPDLHFTIKDIITEGDIVMYRYEMQGTFTAPYGNIPPTGKKMRLIGMMLDRFQDGKIVESWDVFDRLTFLQQLGIPIPPG
jgi:steroid delta-isomerase-like uncharacterized protein